MCVERYLLEHRPRPMTSTTTGMSTRSHRSSRYFRSMESHDATAFPSSNKGMLRPAASARVVRLPVAVLFRRLVGAVSLLVACCLGAAQALAHEIGLSVVELRVEQERIIAQLTFAQSEVEALVAAEERIIGNRSPTNPPSARTGLEALALTALEITLDEHPLQASDVAVQPEPNNTIQFRLSFPMSAGSRLGVRSTLPARLTPGHRQFLVVRSKAGQTLAERILDGNSNTFEADLARLSSSELKPGSFRQFLVLGVEHILTGYDHVVFLMALLLAGGAFWNTAKIVTSFTLAHSITLALAALDVVRIPSSIVEPLIAVSIVYVGLENLLHDDLRWRWLLTFAFGLVHGFGFASVLRELGVGAAGVGVAVPLVSFNLGVELGQVGIMLLVLPLIWELRSRPFFVMRCVPACSLLVALLGGYWLLQRTLFS